MGFGIGPRNCIGMRFAMEEMKIAVCAIVQKFRFYSVEETPVSSLLFIALIIFKNVEVFIFYFFKFCSFPTGGTLF